MKKRIAGQLLILGVGLLLGFLPIYSMQSSELNTLRANKVDLSAANSGLLEQLAESQIIQDQSDLMEAQFSRLLLNAASGGGVNMKMMPDPETGETIKFK